MPFLVKAEIDNSEKNPKTIDISGTQRVDLYVDGTRMSSNIFTKKNIVLLTATSLCITPGSRAGFEPQSGGKSVAVKPIVRCDILG
jgi:hypothetical protein